MKKIILIPIVVSLVLIISVLSINYFQNPKLDKKYLENQTYCEKNLDCVQGQMLNCQLPNGILNCRNIYYSVPKKMVCSTIDMGIRPEDRCICNIQLNKCEIGSNLH